MSRQRSNVNIDRYDVNVVAAVNVAEPGASTETSTKQHVEVVQNGKAHHREAHPNHKEQRMTDKPEGLTEEELADETGEELPDREAMSLINANLAAPVNAAVALNVLSDGSVAYANAEQDVDITQST